MITDEWLCAERELVPEIGTQDAPTATSPIADISICPNPFNLSTTMRFSLPQTGEVKLEILDAAGRRVTLLMDGHREVGMQEVRFDAAALPSGVYFAKLSWGGNTVARKLVLMK